VVFLKLKEDQKMSKAEEILKEKKLSVTEARKLVLELFLKSKKPLSVKDFKSKKKFEAFNESSIYRNLSKLEEAGIIQSIPSSSDFQSFELVPTGHHHHHITCTKCKKVRCLKVCGLEKKMKEMAASADFQLKGHSVELVGLCSSCQKK